MDSRRTDWLIVGGGPAGALAARELARAGREVLCLQRRLGFRKPCGGGLRMDAFGRFGLPKESIRHTVGTIGLHHGKKEISVAIAQTPLAIVDRLHFDSGLREQAQKAGARIIEASFRSLEKNAEGFSVECSCSGRPLRIRCRHLIAADGVLSPVRKAVTGMPPPSLLTHYMETEEPAVGDAGQTARFHFGHSIAGNAYAWDFPGPGGRHLGTLGTRERLERFLDGRGVQEKRKIRGYRIPVYRDPLFFREGIFFLGDAAGQVLPFTYEGIYYALASAALLVRSRIESGDPAEYERRWREHFGPKFSALARLERLFLSSDLSVAVMMRLYRHPAVRRSMIDLWLRDDRTVPSGGELAAKILRRIF